MKRNLWDEVNKRLAESKQGVQIKLNPTDRVVDVQRPRGRPPLHKHFPYENFKSFDPKNPRRRPRCRARGCNNFLRKDQRFACSDACRAEVIIAAKTVLLLMEGPADVTTQNHARPTGQPLQRV